MSSDLPFVSAICVTRDRPSELRQAVRYYEAQTYPSHLRELVVVADGAEADYPGAHWLGSSRMTIGAKRNVAVSRSAGEVIVHWDDDDIYAPGRIEHQVAWLLRSPARIVGYNTMRFLDRQTGKVWIYQGASGYAVGVSLCYWRDVWEARPFQPERMIGEDNEFQRGRMVDTCDSDDMVVATIHPGNTNATKASLGQNPWRMLA